MPTFKLNLVIYNRAIFLLHPSKRKDRKGEVLAKVCEKYLNSRLYNPCARKIEIFDHCIHSSTSQESIEGKISNTIQ